MKRLFILFVLLGSVSATNYVTGAFVPTTVPVNGCLGGHTGAATQAICDLQFYGLPYLTGIMLEAKANNFDTGDCAGSVCTPVFNFSSTDNTYQSYTSGYAITSISNAAGTSTAVMNGGVWEAGDYICNNGTSVSAYNACFLLASATYTSNTLTQVTWAQGGSPGAATGGTMVNSCGASLPGYGAHLCKIKIVIQHMSTGSPNTGLPASGYPVKQAWANQACTLHTWVANANHPINDCLWVPSVGHFYHATSLCATVGYCASAGTVPVSWNIVGGTTTDGTVTWQDDVSNALPLEASTNAGGYNGIAGTPNGIFNINSTTCGGACSVAQVRSGMQIPWQWPYLQWLLQVNTAAIQHYAAVSWVGQISAMRIGVIGGGEIAIYNIADIQTNYSASVGQVSYMVAGYAGPVTYVLNSSVAVSSSLPFQLAASVNQYQAACGIACAIGPTQVSNSVYSLPNYGIGSQGSQSVDLTNWAAGNSPLASNDFPALAMQYWTRTTSLAETRVLLEEQTLKDSKGPGASGCSGLQTSTGSLVPLLIFGTQHHVTEFEIYQTDVLVATDPNYVQAVTVGSGCTPYDASGSYATAMSNFFSNTPASTASMLGAGLRLGAGTLQ